MRESVKMCSMALAIIVAGCGPSEKVRVISVERCWDFPKGGEIVSGSANLLYMSGEASFISNEACPKYYVGVSFNGHVEEKIRSTFDTISKGSKSVDGMNIKPIYISGKTYVTDYNSQVVLRIEKINFDEKNVTSISM